LKLKRYAVWRDNNGSNTLAIDGPAVNNSLITTSLSPFCFSTPFRSRACCVLASMQAKLAGRLPTEHASGQGTTGQDNKKVTKA